ncbi:uncharacterized protein PADG_06019 [Paracoccidioides brasiliensis Pb18]|uniref:Uncharacterized protein n=1 Tax=Paracoccidioides brasiliensis (strain Pb18) TaxID=502780 RepID=C1GFI3_PARBD|nr:uncharacterized protein PADG_06019 [Paracoccidioides brasiliensis Pb18]EEH49940.2 hypothetical protein PADG_06019 [Paracoccidioides brasiliensis Pb18]
MSGSNPFRHKKPNLQSAPQLSRRQQPHPAPSSVHNGQDNKSTPSGPALKIYDEDPSRSPPLQKSARNASPTVPAQALLHPSASDHSAQANTTASCPSHSSYPHGLPSPLLGDDESPRSEDPFNPDASGSGSDGEDVLDGEEPMMSRMGEEVRRRRRRSIETGGAARSAFSTAREPATPRGNGDSTTMPSSGQTGKRATMDVDAFTRMLMTGDMGNAGAGKEPSPMTRLPSQTKHGLPFSSDSSSNTDTAPAASKRALFDRRHLPQLETSRTSHEMSILEADEERRELAALTKPAERHKPPPPKPRRGKPIEHNTGQASPLANSSISNPSASPITLSISSPALLQQSRIDVNKPLPQPLVDNVFSSMTTKDSDKGADGASPLLQHKRPPTPPLTRRHSQMKSNKSDLSRENSSRFSMVSPTTNNNLLNTLSSTLKSPPPLPSRRKDRESSTYSSSDATLLPSPQEQLHYTQRQRSDSSKEDSSDKSSLRSVETISAISNKRTSHGPPRLPPPRRGGGSGCRASLDEIRPLAFSVEDSPTISAAAATDAATRTRNNIEVSKRASLDIPPQSHATDILADLSRLKKEVDDLRGRYEGRQASS